MFRMRIIGAAGEDNYPGAVYLESFDLDAFKGRGHSQLTTDPAKALQFPDAATLLATWKQTSTARPTRPDGKPNRPLTAYTIEVERS